MLFVFSSSAEDYKIKIIDIFKIFNVVDGMGLMLHHLLVITDQYFVIQMNNDKKYIVSLIKLNKPVVSQSQFQFRARRGCPVSLRPRCRQ